MKRNQKVYSFKKLTFFGCKHRQKSSSFSLPHQYVTQHYIIKQIQLDLTMKYSCDENLKETTRTINRLLRIVNNNLLSSSPGAVNSQGRVKVIKGGIMFHAGTVWSSLFSAAVQSRSLELQNSAHTLIRLSSCLAQPAL